MKRVVFNQKGGVGKSSITTNLAAISAIRGLKTLVIDLDPQCNSTHYLLGENAAHTQTDIRDFFEQMLSFQLKAAGPDEFVHETPYENLFLIPSNPAVTDLQAKLESKHKIYKLRDARQLDHVVAGSRRIAKVEIDDLARLRRLDFVNLVQLLDP
jgi:chromosome partitioning protein